MKRIERWRQSPDLNFIKMLGKDLKQAREPELKLFCEEMG